MAEGESEQAQWPREIFAAEIKHEEHEHSGTYVLSEHATGPRWEGDAERDREWHEYVDKDIHDSAVKYWKVRLRQQADTIDALHSKLNAAKSENAQLVGAEELKSLIRYYLAGEATKADLIKATEGGE